MIQEYIFAIYSITEALNGVAISLGVGSSTFAVLFYFYSMRGESFADQVAPLQKTVYIVLRVAMVLILLTEVLKGFLFLTYGGATWVELLGSSYITFIWTLVAVLFLNAILMTVHMMPMKLGPAVQATSWYTLGVITALPLVTLGYWPLVSIYVGVILLAAAGIEYVRQRLQKPTTVEEIETAV